MGAISTSSPALWLKADAITGLVDGDLVGSWTDSSGNGNTATQATSGNKPTYKTSIQNGLPVVRFDGTNDYLSSSASASASGQTVIAVVNPSAFASNCIRGSLGGTNGNGGLECRLEANGSAGMVSQNTSAIATSSSVLPTVGEWHTLVYTMTSATSYAFRINGISAGSGSTSVPITSGLTTQIGRNPVGAGTEWFHGDMAEVITWDRVLTGTEISDIEAELLAKWATLPHNQITGATYTADQTFSADWSASYLGDGAGGYLGSLPTNSYSATTAPPHWVRVQPASSKVVDKYRITARFDAGAYAPAAWTFEGSNDGSTWTTLDTRSSQSFSGGQSKSYTFTNTTAYTYYRLNISATGNGSQPTFSELSLFETTNSSANVAAPLLTATSDMLDPTVSIVSNVNVSAPLVAAASDMLDPTVTTGSNASIAAPKLAAASDMLDPTVDIVSNIDIAAPVITATSDMRDPTVTIASSIAIAAPTLTASSAMLAPLVFTESADGAESYTNASEDIADPRDLEWEQLESYTDAWATAVETLTVAVDPVTRRPGYSLKVVDMQGDVLCELTEASIGTSTRTLNGRGGIDFVLPKLSDELANVQQFSEVQLWRGGHLVPGGWYVVVDPAIDIDAHVMGFQCSGLSYYFERRLIGGDRPELALNGGFESGARYWNFGWSPGGTSGRAPDHQITRDACEGGKALRIYGDSNGHRQFGWQGRTYTNSHPTEPLWIDIQVQARIDDWDGPSKDGWLLYADVRPSSGSNTILYNEYTSMDETTPRDRWMGQSVRVKVAANTTSWVQWRLYPPHGSASFDQVSVKADTELLILKRDPWQAIQTLVEESQDVSHGKSDLNIYTYGSWSGFKIDRRYPWKDGTAVSEAIDEVVRSRNGPDANMEVGARIRRLTVAPKQGASNGRTLVLAVGDRAGDARIVSYSAGIEGDEVATTARVQSSWSGGGMTEVVVSSPRTDGLVLEKLYQAEQDTPTSTLLQQATTAVKYGRADVITRVVMHPDDTTMLMQQLTIGEVVTLDVHDGEISTRANYRIVQIELDPNVDQFAYTVVPEV